MGKAKQEKKKSFVTRIVRVCGFRRLEAMELGPVDGPESLSPR